MYNIVCFIASYITNKNRCNLLSCMIKSVLNQTIKIPIYISISSNEECHKDIKELETKYQHHNYVKIFLHNDKKSQFEHYSFLCGQISEILHSITWCMFCDDDDYCHPKRASNYYEMIKNTNRRDLAVQNNNVLLLQESVDTCDHSLEYCLQSLKDRINNTNVCYNAEYFTYCTRLSTVTLFCNIMKRHFLLHSPLCDVVLGSVLWNRSRLFCRENKWMYAYSIRSSKDRMSRKYNLTYYNNTYDIKLFEDLARSFKISCWANNIPGYSYIFNYSN
jgi:hypothetical protein